METSIKTPPSPSLLSTAFPPVLPATTPIPLGVLHTPSPHQHLLGPCCWVEEDEGPSLGTLSIPGYIWDEHLQKVPAVARLLLAFRSSSCFNEVKKGFFGPQHKTFISPPAVTHLAMLPVAQSNARSNSWVPANLTAPIIQRSSVGTSGETTS